MKNPSIQIHNTKPSRKNPNAKYVVKSVGKNGEILQSSESLNDVKAVKTHFNAMQKLWNLGNYPIEHLIDYTKEQKFSKSGFALPKPELKKK